MENSEQDQQDFPSVSDLQHFLESGLISQEIFDRVVLNPDEVVGSMMDRFTAELEKREAEKEAEREAEKVAVDKKANDLLVLFGISQESRPQASGFLSPESAQFFLDCGLIDQVMFDRMLPGLEKRQSQRDREKAVRLIGESRSASAIASEKAQELADCLVESVASSHIDVADVRFLSDGLWITSKMANHVLWKSAQVGVEADGEISVRDRVSG